MRYMQGFLVAALAAIGAILFLDAQENPRSRASISAVDGPSQGVTVRPAAFERDIEERERLRQEAAEQAETEFAYVRYRVDTQSETPKACFSFSAPLDPDTDYGTYVRFQPSLRAAYSVEGRDLCVGGLSFSDERTATLLAGLPSNDGRTLGADEDVPVDFSDRPAYVGFKGSGVILPRLDADGLPIETVNVEKLDIRVLRVNDRALVFKQITSGVTINEGGYRSIYGDESPYSASEEVWSGSMDVDNTLNAPVVSVFPLAQAVGVLEPGAYFVEVSDAKEITNGSPASAKRWIITTDLAITSYRSNSGLDVTVRSLQSAKPVSGVTLTLVAQNNEILDTQTTSSLGAAKFAPELLNGENNLRPRMIMAYANTGDYAVLDLNRAPVDLSSENITGRYEQFPVDGFLYTERGIYRPGETVHLVAMLRDTDGRSITDRAGQLVTYRPNGMEAARVRFDGTPNGAVDWSYELPKSASRGVWRTSVQLDGVDGDSGSVSYSVEDFVPQRIKVELSADDETPLRARETRNLTVDARFLYGAPGAGLEVVSEARLVEDYTPFENLKGYSFGRHDDSYRSRMLELPSQVADGAGKAVIPLTAGSRGTRSDRPLRLQAMVSVLEPGGRAVSDTISIPYRPRASYIGIKPAFDYAPGENEPATFSVVSVDRDGNPQASELEWQVVEIDYDYDWYREGDQWNWRRTRYVRTVNEGVLNLEDGEIGEITTEGLGRWGDHQVIVKDAGSSLAASYQFWVGWGGRGEEGVDAPDRVRISTPEVAPDVGETADISILSPYDGEAQIVVATDEVLSVTYRSVSKDGTKVSLPVSDEWAEGAYVMVTVFTERDPILNAKPRRAVGVSYVPVDTSTRTFDVSFSAPEIARPREAQTITVTLENGPRENVYMTLAAVDEGILALTNFATPDPVEHYFGKKALGVSLQDDYGRLIDPNLAAPSDIRSGGDALGGEGLSVVPTKTVSLFSGPVDVGRDGTAEITFDLPNFNGEVRLMAVAWSPTAVGSGDQPMIIRDPVPTELSLPRFLAPGDRAIATASIDNVELAAGQFTGVITGTDGVRTGGQTLERTLDQGERVDAEVNLEAIEEGINTLELAVSGPSGFDVTHSYQIQTRSAFLPATEIDRELLSSGASYAVPADTLQSYIPGSGEVVVSFSPLPIDAGSLYASLSRYPYGCTEQTVSRAMPLLYADQLAMLANKDGTADAQSARSRVHEAVETILNRQSPDGAIGLWREGDRDASPWIGAFAVDFLYRAKEQGYSVPNAALDRAYQALNNVSQGEAWRVYGYDTDVYENRWHNDTQEKLMHRSSAFALYVLAKAGQADVARLRYMHDRELDRIQSPLAKAHLGAGLAFLGDKARAKSAFTSALTSLGYSNTGDYYQTPLRDIAGILSLAAEAEMEFELNKLSQALASDAPEPESLMTQEKVFLLLATNALTRGEPEPKIALAGVSGGGDRFLLSEQDVANGVSFTNEGSGPIWRTTLATGAPQSAPPAVSSDLSVEKDILTTLGNAADLTSVTQGDRFVVRITIDPQQNRRNPVIVADLLPAGFEIEAVLRPSDAGRDGAFAWLNDGIDQAQTSEARDDRFVAAIDVFDENKSLAYVVRAVTPGTFTLPGVVAEDMYRPSVFARSGSDTITISSR